MRPVSSRFLAAVTRSHRMVTQIEVLSDAVPVLTLTDVLNGSVTQDAKAEVRGRVDLSLVDDGTLGLIPSIASDRLAPYGNEVRVSRGIRFPDGTIEFVSLGVFRIDNANVAEAPDSLTIQISGQDRSARIADARFEEAGEVAQGTNVATAILNLIQAAYPDVTYEFATTPHLTGHLIIEEGEGRWTLCQQFAANAAMQLYFDGDGTLILENTQTGGAVVSLSEGVDGVLLTAARNWTREGTYNRVIATGENTGETAPVRGTATDDNVLSPTYYYGPFGRVPRFFVSQFFTSNDQCADTAASLLNKQLGTTQSVSFGSLVLPHLEPNDTARITRLRAGINEDHVIDTLVIPLTSDGVMTGATRATQVIE